MLFRSVMLFFAAPFINEHFLDNTAVSLTVMRVFALAIPFMVAARLFNATTQGMHRMQYQVYSRDIGEQGAKLFLSIVVLLLGAGILGVVCANVAAVALATSMALYFALKVLPSSGEAGSGGAAGSLLRYSLPLVFANILVALWLQVDILMLGFMGTTEDVGFYGVALKLSLFGAKIISSFCIVFAPIISDLWNRDRATELKELYVTVSRWIFISSLPIFLALILFSDSLMNIFGSEFVTGSEALIILAIGQFLSAATGAAGMMVLMSGHSKLELLNVAVALVVDVILCLLLIPGYGFMGAAIAHMVSMGVANLMRIVEVWLFMHVFAYDRTFLKPVLSGVASAIMVSVIGVFILTGAGIMQLLILASLLLFFYVLVIVILGLEEQDRSLLRTIRAGMARS